jgi:uncharacterized membrane protein
MIFLVILLAATIGAAILRPHAGPRTWARVGMAGAFVVAGVTHLARPRPFEQHLPDWTPGITGLVVATGIIEIVLGTALAALPSRRRAVGRAIAIYLVAVLPANVYVAIADVDVDGQPGGPYAWLRLPLQAVFIAWTLWSTPTSEGPRRQPEPVRTAPARPADRGRTEAAAGSGSANSAGASVAVAHISHDGS